MNRRVRLWLFKALGGLLERLPERADVAIVTSAFGLVGRTAAWRRTALRDNLAAALSDGPASPADTEILDRFVRRAAPAYGRYWAEGAKLPAMAPGVVTSRVVFSEGEHHLRDAVRAGNGVIIALPHVGSWEWGGMMLSDVGWPMTAVAEVLEPRELFEWFVDKRERMGISILALDERAGSGISRVLKAGGVVGLLCDRDLQGTGTRVELFGRATRVPAGPATLALRSGATLLCAAVYSGPGRDHHCVITAPIDTTRSDSLRADVARVTQAVTDQLGWLIRRAPEQWHVLQPIFGAEQ